MSGSSKTCQLCQQLVTIRYRIQYDDSINWVLVCPQCWQKVSQNNPYYRYGGTWKARNVGKKK
jgi:protein-arginine kinase activator protein McsA